MTLMDINQSGLLQLDGACAALGSARFGPFDVAVMRGERVAILGPSGAGKSTLLKLISRELAPVAGRVLFKARALAQWSLRELSAERAVLPQASSVAFGLECELVVGLGRAARDVDPGLDAIVRQAAALAHAGHLLARRFDTLSGGEQARVQLARIFAQLWDVRDGLVLVDEPLAALDPGLQFELLDSIERFAAQRGHAVVAILHDINHAMQGFERLLLVKEGRLQHDIAADIDALPALSALYGVSLGSVRNEQGDLVITPLRPRARVSA
jgi:iron complex transport system ATP-binding protein